ncbi:hypothetical protein JOF53_003234 [Crossiella equi]|uniref:Uncharacterized protein n=1 Tax=Crossiella equi TaxID=130796 RepID=A0ABS5ADL6_9PSEU|nr:hypothetical protein [Crossiella equi]MBP2474362.1 hypothetical protein [Crossiella equi]
MLEMALTWTGAVLALVMLALMVLPAVVDGQGNVTGANRARVRATRAARVTRQKVRAGATAARETARSRAGAVAA